MLTSLEIENFQSIHRLNLKLGKLTVVTGATGSGKSAVLRALRLLAFNARGVSYITRGEKSCKVGTGSQEQGWAVGIERAVSRGKDAYLVSRRVNHPMQPDGYMDEPEVDTYTKLGGAVPPDVTYLLGLTELNFAAQFDRPFLLDSSGGEIARVLGRLTNVTLLFDAAREANRRRLEVMGDLKRAEANLAGLTEAAQKFRGMKDRHAAVSEAEDALEAADRQYRQVARLRVLTDRLETAQAALKAAVPPEVPDGRRLDDLAGKLARVRDLHETAMTGFAVAEATYVRSMQSVQDEQAAHERLHEVLAEAGQCPTCGQAVA